MVKKYRSTSRLGKVFAWLSGLIVVALVVVFAVMLRYTTHMDPHSFNCTSDSMMMQMCHHPISSAIEWSIVMVGIIGSPLLLAWLIVGMRLAAHRNV
jgi:hypothetical protein